MLWENRDSAVVYLINFLLVIVKKGITLEASMKASKLHSDEQE